MVVLTVDDPIFEGLFAWLGRVSGVQSFSENMTICTSFAIGCMGTRFKIEIIVIEPGPQGHSWKLPPSTCKIRTLLALLTPLGDL
jgi:hypothetical protein